MIPDSPAPPHSRGTRSPGEERTLSWNLSWTNPGFPNSGSTTRVVGNGTFVNNFEIMPGLGYNSGRELGNPNDRREYDLPPIQRLPEYGDPEWLNVSQMGVSERTAFRTVVSTTADQIAVAPGYLVREWEEDFQSVMPIEEDRVRVQAEKADEVRRALDKYEAGKVSYGEITAEHGH